MAWAKLMLSSDFKTIAVHGHRGARSLWPENTLPAFEYAIAAGVDAIELDLAVTKDRVVVVSHDPQLHPPICSGPKPESVIYALTLAEVRQWDCGNLRNWSSPPADGPRHSRADARPRSSPWRRRETFLFNLETKIFPDHPELTPSPEEFVMLVREQVRKHRLESRVILQSFDFRALRIMQRLAPEIARAALYEGPPRILTDIAHEAETGIVAPRFNLVTPEQLRAAQQFRFRPRGDVRAGRPFVENIHRGHRPRGRNRNCCAAIQSGDAGAASRGARGWTSSHDLDAQHAPGVGPPDRGRRRCNYHRRSRGAAGAFGKNSGARNSAIICSWRKMSKEDSIEVTGTVVEKIPQAVCSACSSIRNAQCWPTWRGSFAAIGSACWRAIASPWNFHPTT